MPLQNYRDLSNLSGSMTAGFQFEFHCAICARTWKTDFKPYRMGQAATILARALYLIRGVQEQVRYAAGGVGDFGRQKAQDKALAEALEEAETRYTVCPGCRKEVCNECFDADEGSCVDCLKSVRRDGASRSAGSEAAAVGTSCPNCQTPNAGGRFCAECGFDMASTHKSCPSCGVMTARQARFCTDCGHSF